MVINIWALGNCGKALGDKRRCEERNMKIKLGVGELAERYDELHAEKMDVDDKYQQLKSRYLMVERDRNEITLKYTKYKTEIALARGDQ